MTPTIPSFEGPTTRGKATSFKTWESSPHRRSGKNSTASRRLCAPAVPRVEFRVCRPSTAAFNFQLTPKVHAHPAQTAQIHKTVSEHPSYFGYTHTHTHTHSTPGARIRDQAAALRPSSPGGGPAGKHGGPVAMQSNELSRGWGTRQCGERGDSSWKEREGFRRCFQEKLTPELALEDAEVFSIRKRQ